MSTRTPPSSSCASRSTSRNCAPKQNSARFLPPPAPLPKSPPSRSSPTTTRASNTRWLDFNITPDVAIVDPALAETMPKKLTAHTGMDAMTHAIEGLRLHTRSRVPLALHAIKMISRDLVNSYNGDMEARDNMHNAQCLAGMAFSNALLGIVHSMAHKTGAAYSGGHIVHGCANAMYLPKVIKFNAKNPEAEKRYGEIAAFLGLEPTSDALIARIKEMNKQLDIPSCIKDYEGGIIDEKEFLDKLPEVAELAVGDACTGSNPRPITPARDGKAAQVLLLRRGSRFLNQEYFHKFCVSPFLFLQKELQGICPCNSFFYSPRYGLVRRHRGKLGQP